MPDETQNQEELRKTAEQGNGQEGAYIDPIEERDILKLIKMLGDSRVRNEIASFISIEIDAGSFFASARVQKEILQIVNESKPKEGCCGA